MFESSKLLQLIVITACIQGGVIISQFLITPWVDPSVVGVVRSLETIIALVVLAGSLGMQSIAIRDTAASHGTSRQSEVLRQVFLLVGIASGVVIAGIYVAHEFVLTSAISSYVFTTCGLVLLTNLLRVTTGFAQGAKAIREIYFVLMLVTGAGVILHVVLTKLYGIQGWMAARYLGEFFCLAAVWWKLRAHIFLALDFRQVNRRELMTTAKSGVIVNASLFVRLLVDSLPVLMLTAYHVKTDEIGFFGIAILSLILGLLPLAIIAQRALPELVEVIHDKSELRERYHAFSKSMLKISSAVALLLIFCSCIWLVCVGGVYKQTAMYIIMLALTLPLKAMALACGTILVALRVFSLSLKTNIVEGLLVLLILYVGIPVLDAWAGVLGYVVGAILSAVLLLIAVRFRLADL
jgi:O-antigen/teichoic acid export membrane protein